MNPYVEFKFLHVACALIWVGGGLCLVLLGTKANRARDNAEFGRVLRNVIYMSRVFVPASLGALVFGALTAYTGNLFSELWVILGLIGFAITFGVGIGVLKPRSDTLGATMDREGMTPAVVEQGRLILRLAQFDMVLLFVVVADMVLKPSPGNYVVLLVMALALAAGGFAFLGALIAPRPAAASS